MPEESLKYSSKVTDIGVQKLAQAVLSGKKVDIKYFAIGDANGEYHEVDATQTSLINECYRAEIDSFTQSENDSKQLVVKCIVPSEVGDFTLREAGLFDTEGDLIVVVNTSAIELVPFRTGQILNLSLHIYVQFKNDQIDAVNIVVKPTSEELLKEEILAEVNSRVKIWETDEEDIEELLNIEIDPPSLEDYEEATEEDIRSLFL